MEPNDFQQIATLCYVIEGEEVLLIEKKREVGEGLYNGPGGKIEEKDGSPKEAAKIELREEVKIEVEDLEYVGELEFHFGETPFMYVYGFRTSDYYGRPEWFSIEEMPYSQMWADDRYWMPKMFKGKKVGDEFQFDAEGNNLEDWKIEEKETLKILC